MSIMLSIPLNARLTDPCGVKRHEPAPPRSPAAYAGPKGAPQISEGDRISSLRRQRFMNIWKQHSRTYDAATLRPAEVPTLDNNEPSP